MHFQRAFVSLHFFRVFFTKPHKDHFLFSDERCGGCGRGEGSGRGLKGDAGGGSGDGLDKLRDSDDRYRRWWTGGITDIMQEADGDRLDDGCNRFSSWR